MKKAFILPFLLLLSHIATAQLFTTKSLKGAWREVARIRAGQPQRFADTLFFEVVSSNLSIWGRSSPTAPRVRLKQVGTTLTFGSTEYDIINQTDDRMRLAAEDGLELEMRRYSNKPARPTPNTNKLKYKAPATIKLGTVPTTIEPLVGIWKCYKRTSTTPLQPELKYRLIRLVAIEETPDAITAKIFGFDDLTDQASWIVQRYDNGILYTAGKDERPFQVINCQPGELIIANEGVVYYMNPVVK
ncbi:MAG: hypothetical protein IT256_03325 [Chitinophagaceae bacterium]|nr:hypothetical protein [Chitinophagaceae bacterium]